MGLSIGGSDKRSGGWANGRTAGREDERTAGREVKRTRGPLVGIAHISEQSVNRWASERRDNILDRVKLINKSPYSLKFSLFCRV